MTRMMTVLMAVMVTGPADGPPTKSVDSHYTAVRKDVLEKMNLSDINLPLCEQKLGEAQTELQSAQTNVDELKAAADSLQAQKRALEDHVQRLELIIARYEVMGGPSVGDQFVRGWEKVDGVVGIGFGYALGTGMCMGTAWVFNQPEFRR